MATYTTAKCPYCGDVWTKLNIDAPNTVFGKIGPPVIKCGSCKQNVNTGYKLIRDLNPLEKLLYVYLKNILGSILSIFFIAMGIFVGSLALDSEVTEGMGMFILFFGAMACSLIYMGAMGIKNNYNLGKNDTEDMEATYDANGGFLWSYEYYF